MGVTVFFFLLISGILLICAEVFVPGGILGTLGAIALIGAIVTSFAAERLRPYAFPISIAIALLLVGALVLFIKYFPKSRMGKQMTLANDAADFTAAQQGLVELVGKDGETKSDLRPAGFALIDGQRIDVVSEGGMISKGERIRVVEVEGNRVVVQKAKS